VQNSNEFTRQLLKIEEASKKYGPTPSAFRRWVLEGSLGSAAVKRCGRLVFIDSSVLDARLAQTGQLLVSDDDCDQTAGEEKP
jgi:hypothetical protein